jgi:hypothetical protein
VKQGRFPGLQRISPPPCLRVSLSLILHEYRTLIQRHGRKVMGGGSRQTIPDRHNAFAGGVMTTGSPQSCRNLI